LIELKPEQNQGFFSPVGIGSLSLAGVIHLFLFQTYHTEFWLLSDIKKAEVSWTNAGITNDASASALAPHALSV
jgi:hypothetical protein